MISPANDLDSPTRKMHPFHVGVEPRAIVVSGAIASHQDSHLRVGMIANCTEHVNLEALVESLFTT